MAVQDPKPATRSANKKAKKKKGKITTGQVKANDAGLEGFVDWLDPPASDSAEEMEEDMFSLASGFAVRIRKRAASTQGETTPGSEVSGRERLRRSGLEEES